MADVVVVGGGGGGGYDRAAGGGAGGLLFYEQKTIDQGSYNIKVGRGGSGAASYTNAENGTPSYFETMDTEIALGGGRGATSTAGSRAGDTASAGVVGSGGGGAGNSGWGSTAYGLGTTAQGFNGGSAVGTNSGGGGGAGGPGQSGQSGTNPNNSGNGV